MSESDRELLELAALAVGMKVCCYRDKALEIYCGFGDDTETWSPLTDDGDALRLAVKLRLSIKNSDIRANVLAQVEHGTGWHTCTEPHGSDDFAATRRAIVRAAAEIGKAASRAAES